MQQRYYFHIRRNGALQLDPEGVELSSHTAALEEAIEAARELLAVKVRNGELIDVDQFEITDEKGGIVHILPFRSVLRLDEQAPTGAGTVSSTK